MRYALLGALLMVGGIAARIVASQRPPVTKFVSAPGFVDAPGCAAGLTSCLNGHYVAAGLSQTAYDLVRIGGWALLIFGAVIVAFALVREIRRPV